MTYVEDLTRVVETRIGVRMRMLGEADPVLRHVRDRVAALELEGPEAFVERIAQSHAADPEYLMLVRAVTNGQTFFFRDDEQLLEIVDHLALQARASGGRTMQVWSAGCATGEEPYSLVMLALERGLDVRVLATDVNDARIELARAGRYGRWSVRHVPKPLLERYFDEHEDGFTLKATVRCRVDFVHHNLLAQELPKQPARPPIWDLILCRNLFIYLSKAHVTEIVRRMCGGLAREGVLLLGTAESLRGYDVPLEPTSTGTRIAYRHRPAPARPVETPANGVALATLPTPVPRAPEPTPTPLQLSPEVLAYRAFRSGDLVEAESRLRALAAEDEDRWDLLLSLGHTHLRAHRLADAMSAYARAQTIGDVEAEPSFFVGLAALKADALDTARDALRRALFLEDAHWRAALLLAGVLERQREMRGARRMLVHARDVIASARTHPPFRSFVDGISAATLTAPQARASIELRLSALTAPDRGPT